MPTKYTLAWVARDADAFRIARPDPGVAQKANRKWLREQLKKSPAVLMARGADRTALSP
jgi:hypothetical protein